MTARPGTIPRDWPPRTGAQCRRTEVEATEEECAMAMTAAVKDELSRITVTKTTRAQAEIATMLRFAGALHLVGGHIVVEAELDTGSVARRLRKEIAEVFGHGAEIQVVAGGGLRRGSRYLVRVTQGRRGAGPAGRPGRPARPSGPRPAAPGGCRRHRRRRGGLARRLSRARLADRTRPGRLAGDHLPSTRRRWPWSAPAAGWASSAKAREVRGADRVVVRDGDAIGALLTRIGAHDSVLAWEERRMRREVRATANRLANFDDANLRRSARAAVAAGARVERAMEILGDDAPEHLLQAGRLRLEHKQASLEELGALSDPPMTKDAVAGRIRRLLAMADKRAAELGIPDTESAVTAEMLAQ